MKKWCNNFIQWKQTVCKGSIKLQALYKLVWQDLNTFIYNISINVDVTFISCIFQYSLVKRFNPYDQIITEYMKQIKCFIKYKLIFKGWVKFLEVIAIYPIDHVNKQTHDFLSLYILFTWPIMSNYTYFYLHWENDLINDINFNMKRDHETNKSPCCHYRRRHCRSFCSMSFAK